MLLGVRVIVLLTVGIKIGSAYVASSCGSNLGSSCNLEKEFQNGNSNRKFRNKWIVMDLPSHVTILTLFKVFVFSVRIGHVVFFIFAALASATVTQNEAEK